MITKNGTQFLHDVDWTEFEKLCSMQCTKDEICSWFGMDEKTLTKQVRDKYGQGFSETYRQKKGKGKISLRRMQWQTAQKGNVVMQIFLGKQYLEQSDKVETRVEIEDVEFGDE